MLDVILFDDVKFRGYPQEPQLQSTSNFQNTSDTNYRIKHPKLPSTLQCVCVYNIERAPF